MGRSRSWAHTDRPAMVSLAGQRMMSAVLTGGNAGAGTSAFNPIGRLTPGGPYRRSRLRGGVRHTRRFAMSIRAGCRHTRHDVRAGERPAALLRDPRQWQGARGIGDHTSTGYDRRDERASPRAPRMTSMSTASPQTTANAVSVAVTIGSYRRRHELAVLVGALNRIHARSSPAAARGGVGIRGGR